MSSTAIKILNRSLLEQILLHACSRREGVAAEPSSGVLLSHLIQSVVIIFCYVHFKMYVGVLKRALGLFVWIARLK